MLTDDLPATLDRLVNLGRTPDVNIRPVLLRVLVDLFVSKPTHGPEAVRQFEEIVSRLLQEADDTARLIVAEKLANHAQTPPALLRHLMADRGAIAAKILSCAVLDAQTLQAAGALGAPEMALAVASRSDLDGATIRALAERPEPEIVAALVDNSALTIDPGLYRYLVRRGRDNKALARKLLKRHGDPAELGALFLAADRKQRADILMAMRRHDLGLPRSEPVAGAEAALAQISRVVLLPGMDGLDLILCQALNLPAPLAEQIIDDTTGEPMAVALAALGASPELAARVFILGPPTIGHVYATVKSLVGLVETLSPGIARRLMASMTGEALPVRRPSRTTTAAADLGRPMTRPEARPERRETTEPGRDIRKAS
ncbi:DUF2336 domain-containing protein [Lichenifustis flavocetrariae]|uniref:DUF2336 domain-containing protein n=1 Tax=Lichenifustis flavocetrariae TaxID=2949735 RepID=A0AA41Z1F9_9HYPH|nr:DUF2336 domain-containing protein [Lichenifustis flavocetrariae]MCW6507512.1 DUF2336 domain-containing protein [Lichenifustis flavocetrariae]